MTVKDKAKEYIERKRRAGNQNGRQSTQVKPKQPAQSAQQPQGQTRQSQSQQAQQGQSGKQKQQQNAAQQCQQQLEQGTQQYQGQPSQAPIQPAQPAVTMDDIQRAVTQAVAQQMKGVGQIVSGEIEKQMQKLADVSYDEEGDLFGPDGWPCRIAIQVWDPKSKDWGDYRGVASPGDLMTIQASSRRRPYKWVLIMTDGMDEWPADENDEAGFAAILGKG